MGRSANQLIRNIVAAVPLAALCGGLVAAEPGDDTHSRIEFQVRQTQSVANDSMRATLFAEVSDSTPQTASATLAQITEQTMRKLERQPDLLVQTGSYRVFPVSDKGEITSWRARSEVVIESEQMARVGTAIAAVSDSMQLSAVSFFLSTLRREEVERDLTDRAIDAFLQKAQRVARRFGAERFYVAQANVVSDQGGMPRPVMRAMAADAATVAPDFAGGETRLSVTVTGAILIAR